MRQDYPDAQYWTDLAKEHKIRLPLWRIPCTTGGMRRYLRKIGFSVEEYLEISGERILKDFPKNNPEWPLRAWVGIVLEWKIDNEQ